MFQKMFDDEVQFGLLAFSPLLLVITSASVGIGIGLIVFISLSFFTLLFYPLRNFISITQRFAIILIISVSVVLMLRMSMEAEAYPLSDRIGLFFPLLIMNSLVLSKNESLFSYHDVKSAFAYILTLGLLILIFFLVFGVMREFLSNYSVLTDLNLFGEVSFSGVTLIKSDSGFSIFSSAAGCFFLLGFMFAMINFLKDDNHN